MRKDSFSLFLAESGSAVGGHLLSPKKSAVNSFEPVCSIVKILCITIIGLLVVLYYFRILVRQS